MKKAYILHIVLGMPQIGQVGKYLIYAFPRQATGTHDNNYIKVKERGKQGLVVGKYLISEKKWEENTQLTTKEKKEILTWVRENKDKVNDTIGK